MSDITKRKMEQIAQMWNARGKGLIKHMALQIEEVSTEGVRVRMPFNPEFCVDADQTRLHGGILTALLDSLRPARSRADVIVRAHCFRETRHIAFNSGNVWFEGHEAAEIARGTASFALTRGNTSLFDAMTKGKAS